MSLANLLSESLAPILSEEGKSIYHAPVEDQVKYILRVLRDRGEKGASIRQDVLPADGVREVQERGLASADRGSLYLTAKGRNAVSEEVEDLEEEVEETDFAFIVEATNGKVSTFLTVFSSILTQYDQLLSRNEMKRGRSNIYRLGHYLDALEKIRAAVQGSVNDDSKEAVAKLRAAIDRGFTTGNPGDKLRKVVDAYLEKGTLPKIPISKEVRSKIAAEKRAAKAAKADMPLAAESDAWVEGLEDIELAEWGGGYSRRRAYSNDPRWISAKYNGTAEDGTPFRKGDRVLYYPSTKSFYVGQDAERNWKDFLSAKGDEEGMPYAEDVDLLDEEEGHYFRDGSSIHVDTAFINAIGKALPGFSLQHIGMGEFSLKGPEGEIEFDRMRGKSFPGMSGRSHKLYGPADLIKKLLAAMKDKAKEVTESGERPAMSKVEELENVLAEALGAPNVGWMERMVEQAGEISRTMASRISHHKKGGGDEAWLRGALLEEVKRMEQTMKLMRRRLEA